MQTRIRIRSFFIALIMILGAMLVPGPAAIPAAQASTTYVVNDAGADCGSLVATYTDVQTAVNDAITNNVKKIKVCPGSYSGFMVIGAKTLTIEAAVTDTFPTINAPVAASGVIVFVQDSSGVVLDGLTIDGADFNDALTGLAYGVYFNNASGTVENSSVTRLRCFPDSCNKGFGIALQDDNNDGKDSTLTVKDSNITDFDLEGILADGAAKLTVTSNRITGNVSGGTGTFPYGVVFSKSEVSGSATKNMISAVMGGVNLAGASKVTVSDNIIDGALVGVNIGASCALGREAADSNKVSDNIISDVTSYGVSIDNAANSCGGSSDSNTISDNRISGITGSVAGIFFNVVAGASANKNKVTGNTIYGFGSDFATDPDATNNTVSKNTRVP